MSTNLNIKVDDYSNRVLGVIKEKFGLNDKGDALNKFASMYGSEFVEKEVREEVIKEILDMDKNYFKRNPKGKAMSLKELDRSTGVK